MDSNASARAAARTESESAASLRALAQQCRELASSASLDDLAAALNEIALDYDRQANRAERSEAAVRDRLGSAAKPD